MTSSPGPISVYFDSKGNPLTLPEVRRQPRHVRVLAHLQQDVQVDHRLGVELELEDVRPRVLDLRERDPVRAIILSDRVIRLEVRQD